jgi:D-alanyl-D-alanine carboxypeptidase
VVQGLRCAESWHQGQTLRKKPFTDVLDEEIIAPLGLQHTSTAHLDLTQQDILHGYITLHGQRIDLTDNTHFTGSSSAGLISTMGDVNTFIAALFGGRLLSADLLMEMEKSPGASGYSLGIWKRPPGCTGNQQFHLAGNQEDAITAAISSNDGKYTASMTVVPPPLPGTPEDPSGDSRRNLIGKQAEYALNDTLNALCPAA